MFYKRLSAGMLGSNTYIIGENGHGMIIDPGNGRDEILQAVQEGGWIIDYICLTHTHIDHMLVVDEIRDVLGAKVVVHKDDARAFSSPWLNASNLFGLNRIFRAPDLQVEDGDQLEVGGKKVLFLHTPGHTPGGMSIYVDDWVFTGDTLFYEGVGRTDLGSGSEEDLTRSIQEKLFTLPDATVVYPGHGTSTTIGHEKKNNPYI